MPITENDFKNALSRFASGVTVVTTRDDSGKFHGITVSAFCSVSISPPMILICIDRSTASHYAFVESGIFAVNVLSQNQQFISNQFASPLQDKFKGVEYRLGEFGLPLIMDCPANLECRVRNVADGGDHTIFIAEIEHSYIENADPLIYFRGDYRSIAN